MIATRLGDEQDEGKGHDARGRQQHGGGQDSREEGLALRADARECVARGSDEEHDEREGSGCEPGEYAGQPCGGDVSLDGTHLLGRESRELVGREIRPGSDGGLPGHEEQRCDHGSGVQRQGGEER